MMDQLGSSQFGNWPPQKKGQVKLPNKPKGQGTVGILPWPIGVVSGEHRQVGQIHATRQAPGAVDEGNMNLLTGRSALGQGLHSVKIQTSKNCNKQIQDHVFERNILENWILFWVHLSACLFGISRSPPTRR